MTQKGVNKAADSAKIIPVAKTVKLILCMFTAALLFGADSLGVRPRVDRTDYAVAMFNESLAVAAELVPSEKIRKLFGDDVDNRYLVVEVGMYPRTENPLEVRPEDFALRVNRTRSLLSPQIPKTLAAVGESLRQIALQLLAKCLPETSTYKPVAGYLYFAMADKTYSDNQYELEYKGHKARMILPLLIGDGSSAIPKK